MLSAIIKTRPRESKPAMTLPLVLKAPTEVEEIDLSGSGMVEIPPGREGKAVEATERGASSIAAGCVPCAIGHISTCSGVLSEAMRFARSDGLGSNEVIDRVSHCLEELNTMEREDLSPLKIASLPKWEKDLADRALNVSRETRHKLEGIAVADDLEKAAADAQAARQEITRDWFKHRLSLMSEPEKEELAQKVRAKLEE